MMLVLLVLAFFATAVVLARTVRSDGHGSRPGPRSRPADPFQPQR